MSSEKKTPDQILKESRFWILIAVLLGYASGVMHSIHLEEVGSVFSSEEP